MKIKRLLITNLLILSTLNSCAYFQPEKENFEKSVAEVIRGYKTTLDNYNFRRIEEELNEKIELEKTKNGKRK